MHVFSKYQLKTDALTKHRFLLMIAPDRYKILAKMQGAIINDEADLINAFQQKKIDFAKLKNLLKISTDEILASKGKFELID